MPVTKNLVTTGVKSISRLIISLIVFSNLLIHFLFLFTKVLLNFAMFNYSLNAVKETQFFNYVIKITQVP